MHTIIHLYYHLIQPISAATSIEYLCAQLPDNMVDRVQRYRSNQAARQHLIGRLLLQDGLRKSKSNDNLQSLTYSDQGKPLLPHTQFNISHSAHIVICAMSSHGAIGVDIEYPQSTTIQHLKHSFTPSEWQLILQEPVTLYHLWTRKESIIKATSYKLQDLHKIDTSYTEDHIMIDGHIWHLRSLDFLQLQGAHSAICTELEIADIIIEECFY